MSTFHPWSQWGRGGLRGNQRLHCVDLNANRDRALCGLRYLGKTWGPGFDPDDGASCKRCARSYLKRIEAAA